MKLYTLVLTPWYTAHAVWDWEKTIVSLVNKVVEVVSEYEGDEAVIRSPSTSIRLPSVVRLRKLRKSYKRDVKYSWANIVIRDKFKCAYCGVRLPMKKLSRDHVVPRCQGGKTSWENIVAACQKCNSTKDGRTPEQAGMKLLNRPHKPQTLPLYIASLPTKSIPEAWCPYIDPSVYDIPV